MALGSLLLALGVFVLLGGAAFWVFRQRQARLDAASLTPSSSSTARQAAPEPRAPEAFRTRLRGDIRVGERSTLPGDLLLHGNLVLEDEGVFEGAAEVYGNVVVGSRARVLAPMVVHGHLTLGADARVAGCRVDGDVVLHAHAAIEGPLECDALYLVPGGASGESVVPVAVLSAPPGEKAE